MMLQNGLNIISDIEQKTHLNILVSDISMLDVFDSRSNLYKIGLFCKSNYEAMSFYFYKKNVVPILKYKNLSGIQFDVLISSNIDFILNAIKYTNIKYIYSSEKCIIPNYKSNPLLCNYGYWFSKNAANIITSNTQVNKNIKLTEAVIENKPKVFIVIPIFNQSNFTVKCLQSISKYSEEKYDITCVLVDNGSDSKNKEEVNKCINNISNISIKILNFDKPIGYVKATNAGIKYALEQKADYICLQNNDTEVTEGWMSLLINPITGQTAGSGPTTNSPLAIQGFNLLRKNGVLKDLPNNIDKISKEEAAKVLKEKYKNKVIPITWKARPFTPAFFCTMFRADIFKRFLLDECYGNGYADDIDYCFRIMQYGINLAYVPAAYVLHNHRTTFSSIMSKDNIQKTINSRLQQCFIVNSLNPQEVKKGVIYTAIVGRYDTMPEHTKYNLKDFDYVCFTTSDNIANIKYPWKAIPIEPLCHIIPTNDKVKIARWFKTHPNMFFRNYQLSIWIDGNIKFLTDPLIYVNDHKFDTILIPSHPVRNCIYMESKACLAMKKDSPENIKKAMDFLKAKKYPENNGLVQSNIIVRYHNKPECIKLMDTWWDVIKNYSKRDQLSFDYACYVNNNVNVTRIPWKNTEKYIFWSGIHKK